MKRHENVIFIHIELRVEDIESRNHFAIFEGLPCQLNSQTYRYFGTTSIDFSMHVQHIVLEPHVLRVIVSTEIVSSYND